MTTVNKPSWSKTTADALQLLEEAHRDAERAAVVRWLREADHEAIIEALSAGTWWIDDVLNAAAAAIERGDHLKEPAK